MSTTSSHVARLLGKKKGWPDPISVLEYLPRCPCSTRTFTILFTSWRLL